MGDLQDMGNLNSHEEIQPVNGQEGQNGQDIQGQSGNNNIIYMTNDRDKAIKDYDVLTPQVIQPRIVRPGVQTANFKLKPVMFQMLQIVEHHKMH